MYPLFRLCYATQAVGVIYVTRASVEYVKSAAHPPRPVPVEPAGIGRRLAALILDWVASLLLVRLIFFTFIAFGMVAMDLDASFVIPVVIGLAFIQVVLQFFYFMHMKDKGHEFAKLFMMTGMFFALAFVVTFMYIVWIGSPI